MEYTLRVGNSGVVRGRLFRLQRGICQSCGLDCHKLFERASALPPQERRRVLHPAMYTAARIGQNRFDRLLNGKITEGLIWEADHIQEVAALGGECGLENYQTLCIPCHHKKTVEFMRWRHKALARAKF
uniref:HNH domain-containing protein n=1 Tax=Amorphochlora amoebiformis TaxID=1561963 RepID=A0A7S0GSS3_9EUKA|mmetsp:Transcript_14247/g.22600  ORF Transcript_14247/g.22600 Transcript_14247/m.22600 type:complete len:129 (+) Transcript_14247:1-387(+)